MNALSCIKSIAAFCLVTCISPIGESKSRQIQHQDVPPILFRSSVSQQLYYTISLTDGSLRSQRSHFAESLDYDVPIASLLRHEFVQAELDLVSDQKKILDDTFASANYEYAQLTKKTNAGGFDEKTRTAISLRLNRELYGILLPHQTKRLVQIKNRYLLRQIGLRKFLTENETRNSLEILPTDVSRILDDLSTVAIEIQDKCGKLRSEIHKKFDSVLNDAQKSQLRDFTGEFFPPRIPNVEVLAWQIENKDFYKEVVADSFTPEYRGLFVNPRFRLRFDGVLEISPIDNFARYGQLKQVEKAEVDKRAVEFVYNSLLDTLLDESIVVEIQLVRDQRESLERLKLEITDFIEDWNRRQAEKPFDPALGKLGNDPLYIEFNAMYMDMCSNGLTSIDSILLQHQKDSLVELLQKVEVIRGGMLASLIHGHLGRALRVDDRQKRELEEIGIIALGEIEEKSLGWEAEIQTRFKRFLSDAQRELLDSVLGPELKQGRANIDLIVSQIIK